MPDIVLICDVSKLFAFYFQYEIAREAAMKIKIHYKNNYKFGAGAKSFCKLLFLNNK